MGTHKLYHRTGPFFHNLHDEDKKHLMSGMLLALSRACGGGARLAVLSLWSLERGWYQLGGGPVGRGLGGRGVLEGLLAKEAGR